jgi:oligopeptide/dipeptide ABC transporter ATP-binding protein
VKKDKLLSIKNLTVSFDTPEGKVLAVDKISLDLQRGETLGLVGESGCGKSVTSLSILSLIQSPPGVVRADRILFEGRNLLELDAEGLRKVRGSDISMIFQEPMTSLNPVLPVGRQVAEPLMSHRNLSRAKAYEQAALWLERVKIPAARERLNGYPHQLSGGMRQRIMIAMAMVCQPKLLIADEPTTALDVTIQAQILSLMLELKEKFAMALLLITHDLGIVAQMAGRVVVMYAGETVEEAPIIELFDRPFHPYTRGLLRSMPRRSSQKSQRAARLSEIPGTVPSLIGPIAGCRFAERCAHAFRLCRENHPPLFSVGKLQWARCWLKEHPGRRKSDA